jgi:hypothetical protein
MTVPWSTLRAANSVVPWRFVVVGHGAGAARLHRQSRLGTVERLDLAHMGICGSRCSDQDYIVNFLSLLDIQGLSPFA